MNDKGISVALGYEWFLTEFYECILNFKKVLIRFEIDWVRTWIVHCRFKDMSVIKLSSLKNGQSP